jgi:Tol biopolymer transport system component
MLKGLTIAAAAVLTAVLAGAAGASTSALRGTNGRLVVQTAGGLYVVNPASGTRVWIPGTSGQDQSPAWSPDGRKIAFLSFRKGDGEIYSMDGDGSNVRELTFSLATDDDPNWSPDGQRIVFESLRTHNSDIWSMRSDGGSQTQLTDSQAFDGDPAYSPDGTKIAFTSTRDGNREIYVMNADGSDERRLTFTGGSVQFPDFQLVDQNPAWSPDGRAIYFDSSRDGNLEIYAMAADGSRQARLTDHPAIDAIPVVSPDYGQILFTSDRAERDRREVYTMSLTHKTSPPSPFRIRRVIGGAAIQGDWQRIGARPAGGCTIWGTGGDDILPGTNGRDAICAGTGNDILSGFGGHDSLAAGSGNDRLFGGSGNDSIGGLFGNDYLEGGAGIDTLVPGAGRDTVFGGGGNDRITAKDGTADRIDGGPGRDRGSFDRRLDRVRGVEAHSF